MSGEESTDEIITWSITAAVVAIIVILTIVTVICILKNTPERELEVTCTGAEGPTTLKERAVAYYHKYWKVTDKDAPVFDGATRSIKKSNSGTLRTRKELDEAEEKDLGIYSESYLEDNSTVVTASK